MSNIYLKVKKVKVSKLQLSKFKKFVPRWDFGDLQLTQMSLNFKTSCCDLKIWALDAKVFVAFSIILILKGIITF